MTDEVDLEVVVPAYNEEQRLPATLLELTSRLEETGLNCVITVVDNNSTDGTRRLVEGWPQGVVPVRVIGCEIRGKGAAVRAGITASTARWVGFTDADLAASLDCLPDLISALLDGADVVVGSRRLQMSRLLVQQEIVRRLGGWTYRTIAGRLVPTVYDTQCGFKFFNRDVVPQLFERLQLTGWSFDVELLARACRAYLDVREIPVDWTHHPDSRFDPIADGFRSFADLWTIRNILRAEAAELEAGKAATTIRLPDTEACRSVV